MRCVPAYLPQCLSLLLFATCWCGPATRGAEQTDGDRSIHFERRVRPLLLSKCVECHGPETQEANLRLDTPTGLFAGGDGGRVVIGNNVDGSRLIQLVRGRGDEQMPPDDRLEPQEIAALEQWVRDGAIWPGYDASPAPSSKQSDGPLFTNAEKSFWSFQPIRTVSPPSTGESSWPRSPIDHFILSHLSGAGIGPSPPADKRTLLRRVTFDLTGLPPTIQELADFVADESPTAFAKVVDRLLASPRYGEMWGQHWLDVVRYAESAGHDGNNAYLHAWRYRDYVIKALNDDKPFDQFIIEQLAGDLLPKTGDADQDYQQLAAVGFLQVGAKPVVMRDKHQMLLDIADEQLHTLGVAFLGLTIGCARCHDHKFDPIPTADYYSLAGILTSTHVMADAIADSKWVEEETTGPDGQPVKLMMVHDLPEPKDMQVHLRGNYRTLGETAPRRFLRIIAGEDQRPLATEGSGRLELARWIADAANPLTARVLVNRLWQHHFGRGLVATSGNFGYQGEKPTHPELLDWLAGQLIQGGWSLKSMHRLMLLSSTYQQAHAENSAAMGVDPENHLLWRMPRRRLTAEQLRDALLAVSGELDLTTGGTLFTEGYTANDPKRELFVVDISGREFYPPFLAPRRAVYLPVIRNGRPELSSLFDSPTAHESMSVRGETTVATQALMLMNSPFARQRSRAFADEILDEMIQLPAEAQVEEGIARAYQTAIGRRPTSEEILRGKEFLTRYERLAAKMPPPPSPAADVSGSVSKYSELVQRDPALLTYHRLGSLELNGTDASIEVVAEETLNKATDALTVECWLKPRDVRPWMLVVGRDGVSERLWKIGVYGQQVAGEMQNVIFTQFFNGILGGERIAPQESGTAPLDQWTHVALTCGDGIRRTLVNGKIVDEVEVEGPILTGKSPLTIGARGGGSEWFHGQIDHIAVYNRALDPSDVRRHYRAFRDATGGSQALPKQLAWQAFCQSLFCLNEFIYVQ